ncbi:MAG: hypothetical protein L6R00_19310 [Phycisphaerae bacterium]|nr:hypothetical protein [Phycisphaerae bacterium]
MSMKILVLQNDPAAIAALKNAFAQHRLECVQFFPAQHGRAVTWAGENRPPAAIIDVTQFNEQAALTDPRELMQKLRDARPDIKLAAWTQAVSATDPPEYPDLIRKWGVDEVIPKTMKQNQWDAEPVVDWLRKALGLP